MEVHAHTHTSRKKWTHYFWEFLMLFLAVFCGFLAEYQLEHTIEHGREVQYIKSLLVDLERDRLSLNEGIRKGIIPVRANDSLSAELQKKPLQGREKRIYHFSLLYATLISFTYNDRTISQLKNSGGFRTIRQQSVSDALLEYDTYMRQSMAFAESLWSNAIISTDLRLAYELFEYYRVMKLQDSALAHINEMDKVAYPDDLKLLSYDDKVIKHMLNSMSYVRGNDEEKYKRSLKAFELNKALDSLIRKKYQIQ